MACACKVNRHIETIYRNYGQNVKKKETHIKYKIKYIMQQILLLLFIIIPLFPIILVYVLFQYYYKDNNKISIVKFLRLKK